MLIVRTMNKGDIVVRKIFFAITQCLVIDCDGNRVRINISDIIDIEELQEEANVSGLELEQHLITPKS